MSANGAPAPDRLIGDCRFVAAMGWGRASERHRSAECSNTVVPESTRFRWDVNLRIVGRLSRNGRIQSPDVSGPRATVVSENSAATFRRAAAASRLGGCSTSDGGFCLWPSRDGCSPTLPGKAHGSGRGDGTGCERHSPNCSTRLDRVPNAPPARTRASYSRKPRPTRKLRRR